MSVHPFVVANAFLKLAQQHGQSLTPLQLIKLVYIAHGWKLALRDEPLINEQPQAWQYGPVVPSVYQGVKAFRDQPVTGILSSLFVGGGQLGEDDKQIVELVFRSYGRRSGGQLSSMTHQAGTPWSIIWNTQGKNSPIPDDLIKSHYKKLWNERKGNDVH